MSANRKSTGLKSANTAPKSGNPTAKSSNTHRKSPINKSPRSSLIESRRSSIASGISTTVLIDAPKLQLEPILPLRRGSARSNLQTHPCFQSSLFNDQERAAGSYKEWKDRMINKKLISINESIKESKKDYHLQHVLWTESVKQPRRLTIGNPQEISDWQVMALKRAKSYALAAMGDMRGRVEEKLDLIMLADLQIAFNEADVDESGTLELEEFKNVMKHAMKVATKSEEEIESLFMKINFSSNGKITWEEFCTFMQLNFSEKEELTHHLKEVIFTLPARQEQTPHRTPIQRAIVTNDYNYMVLSSDGVFSLWTPAGELKKIKRDVIEKRIAIKDKGDKQDSKRVRTKWITDFLIITEFNKIVLGSGDRELQFWELSTFDPYCQVYSLYTVPIKLAYCHFDRENVSLCYGDTDGCVNIIKFSNMGETLRLWKACPSVNQMPSIQLDKARESPLIEYIRWKTHSDWIEQIKIDRRLNQIISCSNDQQYAIVIGCIAQSDASVTPDTNSKETPNVTTEPASQPSTAPNMKISLDTQSSTRVTSGNATQKSSRIPDLSLSVQRRRNETVFKVNKGVKVFDFSFEKNLLISGGGTQRVPFVPIYRFEFNLEKFQEIRI